jgi:hypothetical protein
MVVGIQSDRLRDHDKPPPIGGLAHLVERLFCTQKVASSILAFSTSTRVGKPTPSLQGSSLMNCLGSIPLSIMGVPWQVASAHCWGSIPLTSTGAHSFRDDVSLSDRYGLKIAAL